MSSSSSSSQLRLMSDLKSIINEPPEGCSASPMSDDNLFVWSATIFGPEETPWEGGVFGLRLIFGDNYPEKPPRVRFTSEIFHPNGKGHDMEMDLGCFPQNGQRSCQLKRTKASS